MKWTTASLALLAVLSTGCAKMAPSSSSAPGAPASAEYAGAPSDGDWGGDGGGAMMEDETSLSSPAEGAPLRVAAPDAEPEKSDYDRNIQAGVLTAGTFDDTINPATFASFVRSMSNNPSTSSLASRIAGPLTTVTVVDQAGRPIANAAVEVRSPRMSKLLRTGTDGRAIIVSGWDTRPGQMQVRLDQQEFTGVAEGGAKTLTASSARHEPVRALDIALIVDATGSMGDELEYLKVELRGIANEVKRELPNIDQRFALVVYRDHSDEYVTRSFDFSSDLDRFERRLGKQSADGGGDYPEAMDAAMEDAADLSWRPGPGVARVAFLIADAPPHDDAMLTTMGAIEELRAKAVGVYPVAASGVADEAELVMRAAAVTTGGQYTFLTDDSGVGNSHAEPHIPCYAVEQLRDAMARMLVTELAGKRIESDPRHAVRTVGQAVNGVCAPLHRAQ